MEVTEEGMVMEVRLVQSEKTQAPMEVTDEGMVMEVSLVQPEKANPSMVVTDDGMVMEVRLVQPEFLQVVLYQRLALITVEKCRRGF